MANVIKSCKCGGSGFIDWWQNPRQGMINQAFIRCDTCQTTGPKVSLTNTEAMITNMEFEKYQKAVELWNDTNEVSNG